MKRIFILLLAFGILSNIAYSKLPPNMEEIRIKALEGALIINLPGHLEEDGYFSPARIEIIERVAPEFYLKQAIHIKTKQNLPLQNKKSAELTAKIQSSVSSLGIRSVRPLAPEYSEFKMLSSDKHGVGRIYEVSYINPIDPYDACAELLKNPDIEYAVPIFVRMPYYYTPNDPHQQLQYYLDLIKVHEAWDITKGNKAIRIAIVDSGTDWSHPDLEANMWINPAEFPPNNKDSDGNGKIDDFRGWDFVGNLSSNEAYAGLWKEDNDPKPLNTNNSHGTHVAGCAAAVTNNGIGIAAIGFNCTFIPIKCGADNGNIRGIFRGYEAILYAARLGAEIINCSWGGPGSSPAEQDIINQAVELGSTIVVAAGNERAYVDFGAHFPSGYDNVISIGASTSNDRAANFTNYGYTVTAYAPGAGIYATLPNNTYGNNDGTSMASPIAAGVAALIKTVFPNYTPKQIFHQLRSTCDNVLAGSSRPMYYGRINAERAVTFNNPAFPDRKIPGCDITSIKIGDKDALTNNDPQEVKLKIENFLAPTSSNFRIIVTPLDHFIKVSQASVSLGTINTLSSKDVTLNVQLSQVNPWYSGFASLLITFDDGNNYTDFKLVKIPISINSTHSHTVHTKFPDYFYITLFNSHCPSRNVFWAVGSSQGSIGVFYRYSGGSRSHNFFTDAPVYAIYGFNESKAIVGTGPTNGQAQLLTTTNGGANWTSMDISQITKLVNDIYFFNNNDGVMIGDPIGTRWGVANSNNGGGIWSLNMNIPAALADEEHYVGSTTAFNDNIWFGTTKGRVYRSTNKGASWSAHNVLSGNPVLHLSFTSRDSGLVIYTPSTLSADRWVASTVNGGQSWTTRVFNFATTNIVPTSLYSPRGTGIFLALSRNGELFATHDLGKTWLPVLSKQTPGVLTSAGNFEASKIRLWMGGSSVSSLDLDVPKLNVTRFITTHDKNSINFDSVQVGSNKLETITLRNDGNSRVTIEKIEIIPNQGTEQVEFRTAIGTASFIENERTGIIRLRFTPTSAGAKSATVVVHSDATPARLEFPISGFGFQSATKSISTLGTSYINFDTVLINNNSRKSFKMKNTGTMDVSVSMRFESEIEEFTIVSSNTPNTIVPDQEIEVLVEFAPKVKGVFSGRILIESDATPSVIPIDLFGMSTDGSNIDDYISFSISDVYPNPASTHAACVIRLDEENHIFASIIDLTGRKVVEVYNNRAYQGENILLMPISELNAGVYFLKVEISGRTQMKKFIIE